MDKRFLNAFLTPRATILLGHRLHPWCLKHRIQLAALGSPIVLGGEVSPADVVIFCKVASETPLDKWLTLRQRVEAANLLRADKLASAIRNIREHMKVDDWPQFWEKKDGGRPDGLRGVPWALSVIANLIKHGVSHDEAIHLPEAYALWLSTALGIHDGAQIDLLTTDQEALFDEMAGVNKPNG